MKNTALLILVQGIISLLCGILSSKMSFIGKIGIQVMHRDYLIFKSWWKTALVCFIIQFSLILILSALKAYAGLRTVRVIAFSLLIAGMIGAYFTYIDFTTTSHKMMRAKFHIAGYLFWLAWFINCIYFITSSKKQIPLNTLQEEPNSESTQFNNDI